MLRFSKVLALLPYTLLLGCVNNPSYEATDDLLGVWHRQDLGSGPYEYAHTAYLADGRKCVAMFTFAEQFTQVHGFLNQWSRDGLMITTTYGVNTFGRPIGHQVTDEIRSLSVDQLDLRPTEPSDQFLSKSRRLPDVQPERICELALHVINIYNAMEELAEDPSTSLD
ncbi:MAG: hypothetical protein GKR90_20330 [Pseudomonadales bacterium]|nr:hypothetical protein [Pseudomonadales bacterium]